MVLREGLNGMQRRLKGTKGMGKGEYKKVAGEENEITGCGQL